MKSKFTVLSFVLIFFISTAAFAQVSKPKISSAKFDSDGKLIVSVSYDAIAGCYVAINGGLSSSSVSTGITSIQLSSSQAEKGKATIKTKRKYYCKRRTLYVNAELTCLNDVIGSATSSVKSVSVPSSNVKR